MCKLILTCVAFVLALGGLLHQRYSLNEGWFNWSQIHHESLIAIAVCVGVTLFIVYIIDRRQNE